jgi:hypothetical protein
MATRSSKATTKRKTTAKSTTAAKSRAPRKRELIDTGTDKRFVRRSASGQFKEVVDVGKSLAADRRQKSTKTVAAGMGDRGDQQRPARSR